MITVSNTKRTIKISHRLSNQEYYNFIDLFECGLFCRYRYDTCINVIIKRSKWINQTFVEKKKIIITNTVMAVILTIISTIRFRWILVSMRPWREVLVFVATFPWWVMWINIIMSSSWLNKGICRCARCFCSYH